MKKRKQNLKVKRWKEVSSILDEFDDELTALNPDDVDYEDIKENYVDRIIEVFEK